jgi:hypothetical protein
MPETDNGEPLALTTTERQALIRLLKHVLDYDRSPFAPARPVEGNPRQVELPKPAPAPSMPLPSGGTMTGRVRRQ